MSDISFAIRMSDWSIFMMICAFRIMVRSGELCVIQRGMKFKVCMSYFSTFFNHI